MGMVYIYYFLSVLVYVLALPLLIFLSFKKKYKQSIPHRFFLPLFLGRNFSSKKFKYWIHVCSFGEVNSLQKIIDSIPKDDEIFLSVITHTGFFQAHKLYSMRKNVTISYLAFESLLLFVAPKCEKLLVFEAELWLMLFFIAKKNGAKTKLINARISTRSYPRYKKLRFFYSYLFNFVDSVLAQSEVDKERLERIGAKNIKVIGNIKALNEITQSTHYTPPHRLVILCASTHANKPLSEEEAILQELLKVKKQWDLALLDSKNSNLDSKKLGNMESKNLDTSLSTQYDKALDTSRFALSMTDSTDTLQTLRIVNKLDSKNMESKFKPHNFEATSHITKEPQNPLFVVVPRHPERFSSVYNICKKYFKTLRFSEILQDDFMESKKSQINFDNLLCEVLLVDTLGELINFYSISDIVILGGAFARVGGHNPLEVATFKNVLISGKEIFNQETLFSYITNYYLIESSEISAILKDYKDLYIAKIKLDSKEMIKEILN